VFDVHSDGVADNTQELKPGVTSVVKSGETCLNAGFIQQVCFEFRTPHLETIMDASHITHVDHFSVLKMTEERVQIRVQNINVTAECSMITLEHIVSSASIVMNTQP